MPDYSRNRWKRFRRRRRRPRLLPAEVEMDTSRQRRGKWAGLRPNRLKRYHHQKYEGRHEIYNMSDDEFETN